MAGGEGMSWWSGTVKNEEASADPLTKSVVPTEHEVKDAARVEWERQRDASVRPKVRTNRVKSKEAHEPLMTEYVGDWANGGEPVLTPEQDQEKCRRASRYRRHGHVQQKDELEDSRYVTPILVPPKKQAKQIPISLADDSSLLADEVKVEEGGKKVSKEGRDKPSKIATLYACSLYALDDLSEEFQSLLENLRVAYDDYGTVPVVKGKPE